jgi:hypothetical protein
MSQGVEQFRLHVRERILREHRDRVFLNYCPRCGGLATRREPSNAAGVSMIGIGLRGRDEVKWLGVLDLVNTPSSRQLDRSRSLR